MWQELGISGGTAIIILITLYFVVKWAVKNGIKEEYKDITGKELHEEIELENITKETEERYKNYIEDKKKE